MSKTLQMRALYQREYPLLLTQVERLVALSRTHDRNIAFIALFGSVARLEPGRYSDADVLILVHDQSVYYAGISDSGAALLWMAYQGESPHGNGNDNGNDNQLSSWPVTAVVSNATASDLDADFLSNVARDGIELYRQDSYTPPARLAHLIHWEQWRDRVRKMLGAGSASQ